MKRIQDSVDALAKEAKFGSRIWVDIQLHPINSLTKRQFELLLIRAAIDSGLVVASPAQIARAFSLGLAKAHGYLTDLALRSPALSDVEALKRLALALSQVEVTSDGNYLTIPLNDAALRIWLERKMSHLDLSAGESIRRDLVKLTPSGLAKILEASDGILTPFKALHRLPEGLKETTWVKEAIKKWDNSMKWPDALSALGNTAAFAQAAIPLLVKAFGA